MDEQTEAEQLAVVLELYIQPFLDVPHKNPSMCLFVCVCVEEPSKDPVCLAYVPLKQRPALLSLL